MIRQVFTRAMSIAVFLIVISLALMGCDSAGSGGSENTSDTGMTVIAVAAGGMHSLAVAEDGTVWAWGNNEYGQLGDGTTEPSNTPFQIEGLTNIVSVGAGENHSVAVDGDGRVWAWGRNQGGQLGNGTTTDSNTPVQVNGASGVVEVFAGWAHTLALKNDGTLLAWGANWDGQMADGTTEARLTPGSITGLTEVIAVSTRDEHSVAVRSDGTVWTWGRNNTLEFQEGHPSGGQLGIGTVSEYEATLQQVCDEGETDPCSSYLTGIVDASTNVVTTVALGSDGTLYGWGENGTGSIGNGTREDSLVPASGSFSETTAVDIDSGWYHSVILTSEGELWSWGGNWAGQVGDGTTETVLSPKRIEGIGAVDFITIGGAHSMAVLEDGSLYVWGNNEHGQLGDGTNDQSTSPVEIPRF